MRHLQEWAASQLPLARMDLLNLRQPPPHPPPPAGAEQRHAALGGSALSPFLGIQLPEASPGGPSCQGQELLLGCETPQCSPDLCWGVGNQLKGPSVAHKAEHPPR